MLSDSLSDVVSDIEECQREQPDVYDAHRVDLDALRALIDALRIKLDAPPCIEQVGSGGMVMSGAAIVSHK